MLQFETRWDLGKKQSTKSTFKPNENINLFAWAIFNNKECEIKLITSKKKELKNKEENINPKKTSGFNIITDEILKQLSRKATVKLTYLINTTYRLNYVWIVSEVILIPKPGKPPNEVSSYRSNLFSSCNFETI